MTAREFVDKFGVVYDADAGELRDKDDNEVEVNDNCLQDHACPECGDRGYFKVEVSCTLNLCDSGIDDDEKDDYNDTSYTTCCDCGYAEEMRSFHVQGLDNLLQEIYDNGQEADEGDDDDDSAQAPPPPPETSSDIPPPTPPIGWDTSGIQ